MTPETLDRLRTISTASITTLLFKRGFRNVYVQGVLPIAPTEATAPNMVGPAMTLCYIPAREDLDQLGAFADPMHPQRRAVETAAAGCVLVMDCRGDARVASAGEILMTRLKVRGSAGMVTDGGLRDSQPIARMGFPVFAAKPSAPLNLAQHHAVDIDVPIGCGGVAVYPGDVVVGDYDGVVIIPAHLADEVARDGAEQELLEAYLLQRIVDGAELPGTYPPSETTRAAFEAWRTKKP